MYQHHFRWYKPWFYSYVRNYLTDEWQKSGNVEFIPTRDFFHRQNRAYFWLLKYIIPFANNPIFRYPFGWTMPPKFSLIKWMKQTLLPKEDNINFVCQDFGFKLEDLKDSLKYSDEIFKVYPIWLCPTRHCIHKGLEEFSLFRREDCHVDVGLYG